MKNIYSKTSYVGLLTLIITLSSCKKFVELSPPTTQLTSSEVFSSDTGATAVLSTIYLRCSASGFASGGQSSITMMAGLSSDELDAYMDQENFTQLSKNSLLAGNGTISSLWADCYSVIYKCNLLLEDLKDNPKISPAVSDQLSGEALFMRAFIHFYLAGLFGNVPYVDNTDYRINNIIQRSGYPTVMNLIIEDLKKAKSLLSSDYTFTASERIRPNKWAATALLARTYLYTGQWEKAETEASLVLQQNQLYGLSPINEVFLKNSKEAIWQIKPVSSTLNTNEGSLFILVSKPTNFALRTDFLQDFENTDLRKQNWIGTFSSPAGSWNYPYKYKIRNGATPLNEYSMVLRLAEQYLIRSEARVMQDKLSASIEDLDKIRFRAGLSKIAENNPNISKADLLLAIEQERKHELFTEWGHRWLDLKRTRRADAILSGKKTGWNANAVLYPIPADELRINKNLVQNGGYQ